MITATSKGSFLSGVKRRPASAEERISSSSVSLRGVERPRKGASNSPRRPGNSLAVTSPTSRSRVRATKSAKSRPRSLPASPCAATRLSADAASPARMCPPSDATSSAEAKPKMERTSSSATLSPQKETTWSSIDSASRMPPSEARAITSAAAGSSATFSCLAMASKCFAATSSRIGWRSKRWQRLMMVAGNLCASVVAKRNFTCGGGSSRVFSRALKAGPLSMCTSSIR